MKIEKINENQIRCTLSHQDLAERKLKLSELAYGTDKAKALFHDMMQQASFEVGFEAENIPIMIEAIPVSRETLILIITKVENPDELDSRFSRFSPDGNSTDKESFMSRLNEFSELLDDDDLDDLDTEIDMDEDEDERDDDSSEAAPDSPKDTSGDPQQIEKIYAFSSLDDVIRLARSVHNSYFGVNDLYKDAKNSTYYLILHKSAHSTDDFTRICNAASEYGRLVDSRYSMAAHFNEHFEVLIDGDAIGILATL